MSRRPATVEVQIRNIAFGGDGVGEVVEEVGEQNSVLQGITAFVPFTAVGDRVLAPVEEKKKNHLRCDTGEIVEASNLRVEPACQYFSNCGGCHFQHISTEAQLEAKRSMLVGALRVARCSHTVLQAVRPIVAADMLGYRRRIRLHVNPKGQVGFYQPRSRVVVPISDCLVADSAIRKVLPGLADLAPIFAGVIGSVLLESDSDGVVALLVAPYQIKEQAARKLLNEIKHVLPNCSIHFASKEIARSGRQLLSLSLPENTKLRVAAGGFSQANWSINLKMIDDCLELLNKEGNVPLFDLYSGAGNFSLPAAVSGRQVTAVEQDETLVRWGQQAVSEHGLEGNLTFVQSSVESYCRDNSFPQGAVILADPPRSGLGPLVKMLQPARALYFVSCHLPSFVRDLKQLLELGWEVESIQPYDMFPQTTHMEILGVFRKPA